MKNIDQHNFLEQIPINAKRLRRGMLNLLIICIPCLIGILISKYFWEGHTYMVYSRRAGAYVRQGWPVIVNSWSWIIGVACIVGYAFIHFMQDWRNPALAITSRELFINQQFVRNTFVPFSNIKKIDKLGKDYHIRFIDNIEIIKQQFFLFRPIIKSNFKQDQFFISNTFNAGDIDAFMKVLETKITKA